MCVLDTFNDGSDAWNQLEYLVSLLDNLLERVMLRDFFCFLCDVAGQSSFARVPSVSLRKHSGISLEYARNNEQFQIKRKVLPVLTQKDRRDQLGAHISVVIQDKDALTDKVVANHHLWFSCDDSG